MSRFALITPLITTLAAAVPLAAVATFAPSLVTAQTIPPACQPLVDAQRKQLMTPSHVYIATAEPGGKSMTYEAIYAAGNSYILVDGKWQRNPQTNAQALAALNDAIASTKGYTCQKVADETLHGVAATVYTSRSSEPESRLGGRTWIAKETGLPLQQQTTSGRVTMRYEYSSVHVPAGVQ